MPRLFYIILSLFLVSTTTAFAQNVGVGTMSPDASAILDLTSTDKGVLVPRMTSAQRTSIASPAVGLLVFDTDTKSFWFNETSGWAELRDGNIRELADDDGDTKVEVENSPDSDEILFSLGGTQGLKLKRNVYGLPMFEILSTGGNNTVYGQSTGDSLNIGTRNVLIGKEAGSMLSSGHKNTFVGFRSGEVNNASRNTFIGMHAGLTTTGGANVFVGCESGENNTGSNNIFIGNNAGKDVTGSDQLIIHNAAGDASSALIYGNFDLGLLRVNGTLNVNGAYAFPTADGSDGQILQTDGSGHIFFGEAIDISDSDGDTRIDLEGSGDSDTILMFSGDALALSIFRDAVGNVKLGDIGSDNDNISIGTDAGMHLEGDAFYNTFIGGASGLQLTTGDDNTFLGAGSGLQNVTGADNTYIGTQAGAENLQGGNTFLGKSAGQLSSGANNVFIGLNAGLNASGSNKLLIDNSDADSTEALIYGEFDNDWLRVNGRLTPTQGITDIDGDTRILLQHGNVDDTIHFEIGGAEVYRMTSDRLEFINDDESIFIGNISDNGAPQEIGNVGIGHDVLLNYAGVRTVAIGINAMKDAAICNESVAIGYSALKDAAGQTAIGIGGYALSKNNGQLNCAIGGNALRNNVGGVYNNAFGFGALRSNIAGSANVGVGWQAGNEALGDNNIFVGAAAGTNMTTGNANVVLGNYALGGINYDGNVAIGYEAGANAEGDSSVFLGYQAGYSSIGNNKLYIANSNVDSSGALIYGEFDHKLIRVNGNLNINGAYQFPVLAGSAGQVLKTDGSGMLTWQEAGDIFILHDADDDTKIQLEESPDEDVIRFDVAGSEVLTLTDTMSTFKGTGRDLLQIKTLNNTAETGLAFQNTGSSYTWSIHRSAASNPDLVFSGGNTPSDVDQLTERMRITAEGNVVIAAGLSADTLTAGYTATDSISIGTSGTPLHAMIVQTLSKQVPILPSNAETFIDFTIPGATMTGVVHISPADELPDGIVIGQAYVSAPDTVSVKFVNYETSGEIPFTLDYRIAVINY